MTEMQRDILIQNPQGLLFFSFDWQQSSTSRQFKPNTRLAAPIKSSLRSLIHPFDNRKGLMNPTITTLLLAGCGGGGNSLSGTFDPPEEEGIRQLVTDFYDFEGRFISSSFTNVSRNDIFSLQGPGDQVDYYPTQFLGPFGSTSEALEFRTDVSGQDVVVSFDFFRVHTWGADAGNTDDDRFVLEINGEEVISELFGPFSRDACSVSRSGHCDFDVATRTGTSESGSSYTITKISDIQEHAMGGGGYFATKYFVEIDVGAVDGPLEVIFSSTLNENLLNEYFAIDNFKIVTSEFLSELQDNSAPVLLGFATTDKVVMFNETAFLNIDASDESGLEAVKIVFSNSIGGELVITASSISDTISIQGSDLDEAAYSAEYISLVDASLAGNQSVYFRDGSLRGASEQTMHTFDLSTLDFRVENPILINVGEV